jgi:hypothetical protein
LFNAPTPPPDALPSRGQLFRSTLIALGVAAVLLVTVVLPAEYGVDPTGVGDVLGLKRMGEIKVALALEAEADAAADAAAEEAAVAAAAEREVEAGGSAAEPSPGQPAGNLEMAEITLEPGQGRELKLVMKEGGSVRYEWWTVGGVVSFNTHGEPPDAPGGSAHSYGRGQDRASDEGVLTAAFDGLHGWFWRNRTQEPVTVTLRVQGDFQELKEIP